MKEFCINVYVNNHYNIELVRTLLQHSSVNVTQRYIGIGSKEKAINDFCAGYWTDYLFLKNPELLACVCLYDFFCTDITMEEIEEGIYNFERGYMKEILRKDLMIPYEIFTLPEALEALGTALVTMGPGQFLKGVAYGIIEGGKGFADDLINGDAITRGEAMAQLTVIAVDIYMFAQGAVKGIRKIGKLAKKGASALKSVKSGASVAAKAAGTLDDLGGAGIVDDVVESGTYSGEEWCRYFRETYGNNNVTWENATPSQLARSWQGVEKYPGVDNYIDVTAKKGEILYRGEPNGTEYFTTLDAIEQSGRDATKLFEGLQVEKNPIHGYRGEMQGYIFNEDVASAYGITNANPQFGKGGLPQYYVPDVQDLIDKGILTPVDNIKLNKGGN